MAYHTVLVLAHPADRQLALLEELPEGTAVAAGDQADAFRGLAPDADVLLNWSGSLALFEEVFRMAPRLRWVHSRAAGLDGVLFPALVESPVPLTNGRGVFSQALGEFVVAAALFFAKDLRRMVCQQQEGRWEPFDLDEACGQTMGIIGYGDIGRACAQRAKAFGMKVVAVRRRPDRSSGDEHADRIVGMDEMLEVLPDCDYVVAAAPLTANTRGLIDEIALNAMKPSVVVMNVGRGPVIDEAALIRALETGRIRGAALDVFEVEPLPAGHPFYRLENVLLSPHCADHTRTWLEDAMRLFLDNFARYEKGEPLRNVVDKRLGY